MIFYFLVVLLSTAKIFSPRTVKNDTCANFYKYIIIIFN